MEIQDYIRDPRILSNRKYEFRHNLFLEHIDKDAGTIKVHDDGNSVEEILVFKGDGIRIPRIRFYPKGITHKKDRYLKELVAFYMHINPKVDDIGVKKMVEFIVAHKVAKRDGVPIMSFEDLEDTIRAYAELSRNLVLPKDRYINVLYSKESGYTTSQKRETTMFYTFERARLIKEELIHLAAQLALDTTHYQVKVGNPRVFHALGELPKEARMQTVRTMRRNMANNTEEMLKRENMYRYFLTEAAQEKFERFLALPGGTSMDDAAKKLKASKSTIHEYSYIKKELNL